MDKKNDLVVCDSIEMINQIEKASIDVQILTAKKFPRETKRCIENCIATVTIDDKTASTCGYVLRFRGSEIKGKSVYLARIMAQNWGNLRCDQTVIGADATHVIGQGICHDLETNFAIRLQVKKPITKKDGTRYSNDMIATAGMAAAAIALRNAILQVIPEAFSTKVYDAAERKVVGNLSNTDRLLSKRKEMIDLFNSKFNVPEKQVLKYFEIRTVEQLDPLKVKEMIDLSNSFNDGALGVTDVFKDLEKKELSTEDIEKNKKLFTDKEE